MAEKYFTLMLSQNQVDIRADIHVDTPIIPLFICCYQNSSRIIQACVDFFSFHLARWFSGVK